MKIVISSASVCSVFKKNNGLKNLWNITVFYGCAPACGSSVVIAIRFSGPLMRILTFCNCYCWHWWNGSTYSMIAVKKHPSRNVPRFKNKQVGTAKHFAAFTEWWNNIIWPKYTGFARWTSVMSCTTNKKAMSSWWQNNEILGWSHEVWAKIEVSFVFHRKNQKFAFLQHNFISKVFANSSKVYVEGVFGSSNFSGQDQTGKWIDSCLF